MREPTRPMKQLHRPPSVRSGEEAITESQLFCFASMFFRVEIHIVVLCLGLVVMSCAGPSDTPRIGTIVVCPCWCCFARA